VTGLKAFPQRMASKVCLVRVAVLSMARPGSFVTAPKNSIELTSILLPRTEVAQLRIGHVFELTLVCAGGVGSDSKESTSPTRILHKS
jgi:hypothetical protein